MSAFLWDIKLADMLGLDRYENVAAGLYRKTIHPVLKMGGGTARAIVYVGKAQGGRPAPGLMENIVAAAREWEFPPVHIRALERFYPLEPTSATPARRC